VEGGGTFFVFIGNGPKEPRKWVKTFKKVGQNLQGNGSKPSRK
jgi:hypothetical protein